MKQWFPFTDYDLYAYLIAGSVLVVTVDYTFAGATLINRDHWTFIQIVFWIAAAYLSGQLVAGPAAALLENIVAQRLLIAPSIILLGLKIPRLRERLIRALFCPRYYQPLPTLVRERVMLRAAGNCLTPSSLPDAEAIFQAAFAKARTIPDVATRLDQFRNLYGFSRNLAFVAIIATALLAIQFYRTSSSEVLLLSVIAAIAAIGFFGRFIKFYAAFAAEVLRGFAFDLPADGGKP
ncbi:MAG TPA: hypothetical protein VHT51_13235 [Micropepsaceae bacterium]|jgi:hypothetical protein|nr:hypothetical protein [Micropepsaceae bacterium]